MTEERIRMIREGLALLNPLKIKIEDEGHLHVGHAGAKSGGHFKLYICLLYTSPSPRDATLSRMPSSA